MLKRTWYFVIYLFSWIVETLVSEVDLDCNVIYELLSPLQPLDYSHFPFYHFLRQQQDNFKHCNILFYIVIGLNLHIWGLGSLRVFVFVCICLCARGKTSFWAAGKPVTTLTSNELYFVKSKGRRRGKDTCIAFVLSFGDKSLNEPATLQYGIFVALVQLFTLKFCICWHRFSFYFLTNHRGNPALDAQPCNHHIHCRSYLWAGWKESFSDSIAEGQRSPTFDKMTADIHFWLAM